MDTKRLILSITLTLSLVIGYNLLIDHILKLHPNWARQTAAPAPVNAPATAPAMAGNPVAPTTLPTTVPAVASVTPPAAIATPVIAAVGTTQPVSAQLGADPAVYPVRLDIDPQGAGLKSVTLSEFYVTAAHKEIYRFEQPLEGFESATEALATRVISINGVDQDISGLIWKQAKADKSSATYSATVNVAGIPALTLTKQFVVQPKNTADGSGGYEVLVNQGFTNLTPLPLKVSLRLNGPTPPARENDLSEDRRYVAGYDDGDKHITTGDTTTLVSDLKKDKPAKDLVALDHRPMLWVGACNSYFDVIVRPDYAGQVANPPVKIVSAVASGIDTGTQVTASEYPTSLIIDTSDFTVAPGGSVPFNLHVFFGPKQRGLLNDTYYSQFPRWYGETLVYSSGICGYITFNWLIVLLSGILWFFHLIFHDWGLAIIGLVCLVRLLLHPITKKAQINMVHMGKMGPEIERLKKKYGDNKDELNKAMMNVYKEQGMTPILGCLPMFLQTPIWIALWSALQSTFELRQAPFLQFGHVHLTWISDLSHPDALISFGQTVSLFGFLHFSSLNILPLLLAVVFYFQQSLQPMPANMTPEQEQQRKMMKWMSLLFPIMLYGRPSGLSLYILTSTTIGIVENKIIRDHIKQREEAEKSGKIIVDAPGKKKRGGDLAIAKKDTPKKSGGIAGFLADLQSKVEDVRREAEKRAKDRA
jgi:YidC/Oxa1 family membrane protein insertase